MTYTLYMASLILILVATTALGVKSLWWDHRAMNARLRRSDELLDIIWDPTSTLRAHVEAGIELYDFSPELSAKLRDPATWSPERRDGTL